MKTLTVRVSRKVIADIEAESRGRNISKSDVIRERLERTPRRHSRPPSLDAIGDLVGSVDRLPADLSARKKRHLGSMRYGKKRPR